MKQIILVGASLVFLVLLRLVNRRNEQRETELKEFRAIAVREKEMEAQQ